jgi:NADH-quinone oxidoreductase subunit A
MALVSMGFMIFWVTGLLFLVSFYLSYTNRSTEKLEAYECGFMSSVESARMRYEIFYYLIGILYLIFDLEIIFLFPLGAIFFSLNNV